MKINQLTPKCQDGIRDACESLKNSCESSALLHNSSLRDEYESEFGRMIYTISILLMFSFVIILLMIRSIKRTHSTVEMDALLDAMRFREELDIRDRQRRRLLKAKTKVTAWLNRAQQQQQNGEPISSSNHQNHSTSRRNAGDRHSSQPAPMPNVHRQKTQYSISTVTSEIPEIVVSHEDGANSAMPQRAHTPAISLIYDFAIGTPNDEAERRKSSFASSIEIVTSSSSSSIASSSIDNHHRCATITPRTLSHEAGGGGGGGTNPSSDSRRVVDFDDKSFSLDQ